MLVGELAETRIEDNEIRILDRIESFNVIESIGIDRAIICQCVADSDVASVIAVKDLRKHWHRLFGAVFLVATDKDDVLALARAVLALVVDREMVIGLNRGEAECQAGTS